uniref:Uncharacterized protein n=1 Tax=Panagrolaimus sp. JU765 TaxID=591449 RepID=A0AC34QWM8_9BILA
MNDPELKKLEDMLTQMSESKAPPGKQQIVDTTKQAINAVRHFKHVVHAIEKFVLKSRASHKLHGFYLIDSIVRQSQKKFKHKDVFKPRFAQNLKQTLQNALLCPAKDRPKIVRMINLWRANKIFEEDLLKSLLQHCSASGLSIDVESVEKAVKGDKADMSLYKSVNKENSAVKPSSSSTTHASKSASSSSQIVSESVLTKHLAVISPDYQRAFSENPTVLSQVQSLIGEKVKQKLESESKKRIKNILSAGFDYSDEEDSGDEYRGSQDSFSKEKVEKALESLLKESGIQSELRRLYLQHVGESSFGNGREESRDRKRRRSDSRERKDFRKDKEKEKDKKSREKSHRRRSSSPRDKREKERKKLGWPQETKREHFLISSRTIWLGRIPANCSESEIKNALADFGVPEKTDIIHSRACAYVTMPDRRSAYKIVDKMAHKLEISRKPVRVNWGIGQGLNSYRQLQSYWDGEYGYHQIPWSVLPDPIDPLFDGSYADVESLPPHLKDLYDERGRKKSKDVSSSVPSKVPVPLPSQIVMPPNQPEIPSQINTVAPQMNALAGFPSGMLPPGLTIPVTDVQNGGQNAGQANLNALVAAAVNSAQAGILGAAPNQLNLLNSLNAYNVQPQLGQNPVYRHDAPLPDQKLAFQQFQGNPPPHRFGNGDFSNFGSQRPYSPRSRGGFGGGQQTAFNMPDLNKPPPNIADLSGQPLRFVHPAATGPQQSLMSINPNFAQLPPNFNPSIPPPSHDADDHMDIASPEAPPGL